MASVNSKGTDTWHASLRIWQADPKDSARGEWKRTWRTTGVPASSPKVEAEKVAEALQAAALAVAPANPRRADQRTFVEALESIWRAAGVAPPQVSSTWREHAERFLESRSLTPRSMAGYQSQFKIFTQWLGKRADDLLWNLGYEDFHGFYLHLMKGGRSAKTARNHMVILQSAMERAFLQGIVPRNPVKLVNIPGAEPAKRQPFTSEEIDTLLRFLDAPPAGWVVLQDTRAAEWKTAMLLGLCCGMRMGDATGRRWKDFDFTAGTVSLVPEKKTKKGRVITLPLAAPLAKNLKALEKAGEWVTPTLQGKRSNSANFGEIIARAGIVAETNREARKDAGHTIRLKSFHSLRHSLNTMLAASGAEKQIRMLISDHDDPRVSDRYTHGTVERMAEALRRVFPQ